MTVSEDERPDPRRTCRQNTNLPQKVAGFLPQPLENPGFGKHDRILGQAQFFGHAPGRNAIDSEPAERLPGRGREVGLHDRQQFLNDMFVVIPVPLAGEIVIRVGKPFEKPIGRIAPDGGPAMTLPTIVTDLVHRHLPKPSPERPLPLPVKPGDLTEHDDENLLGQVGALIPEPGNATEPALDEGQIDALQPVPVGGIRPRHLEPIQQAEGSRLHEPWPGQILGFRFDRL